MYLSEYYDMWSGINDQCTYDMFHMKSTVDALTILG